MDNREVRRGRVCTFLAQHVLRKAFLCVDVFLADFSGFIAVVVTYSCKV